MWWRLSNKRIFGLSTNFFEVLRQHHMKNTQIPTETQLTLYFPRRNLFIFSSSFSFKSFVCSCVSVHMLGEAIFGVKSFGALATFESLIRGMCL